MESNELLSIAMILLSDDGESATDDDESSLHATNKTAESNNAAKYFTENLR